MGIWASFTRPWRAAATPAAVEVPSAPRAAVRVGEDAVARSLHNPKAGYRVSPFVVAKHPKEAMPSPEMAMDDAFSPIATWADSAFGAGLVHEGLQFLGFPYLAELAQRPEYRRISETIARYMTREWIEIQGKGDEDKTKKIARLNEALDRLNVREAFRKVAEQDGFFGRGHLFIDCGASTDAELATPIGDGWNEASKAKIVRGTIKRLSTIEAVWCYPTSYNSNDPLSPDWYRPGGWFVMGKQVHASRILTFVGREVPDILKPAYSFGGLSLSQMAQPYVNNWLDTREAVADIIKSFSVFNLSTNLGDQLTVGAGDGLFRRAALFNNLRDNRGLLITDKETEEFQNISAPLGTLDVLQAQTQEHMAAVSGIPLVLLLGISPAGLNASSEGELRVFYDWIHASQEILFRPNLTKLLGMMMLTELGEVDPDITFRFVPLWSMSEKEIADKENVEAQTDGLHIENGVLSPLEARKRLAADPESPYHGLDPDDLPLPPVSESDQDPPGVDPEPERLLDTVNAS